MLESICRICQFLFQDIRHDGSTYIDDLKDLQDGVLILAGHITDGVQRKIGYAIEKLQEEELQEEEEEEEKR